LRIEGTAQAIAIFAALLIVSTGLCGLTSSLTTRESNGLVAIPFGIVELIGMLVGLVGFVGSIAAAILQAFRRWFGRDDVGATLRLKDDEKGERKP